ncbi:MAG TPA: phenylalanine--tRNA ligase subunit alpha [Chthoniobacterales bacterium]|jgi:phenylalanyl-tRNA synthetase alpha chain|nr:phenylalanine--tRNA ligase subunit alpha [Chthoniobacterales bacterium]
MPHELEQLRDAALAEVAAAADEQSLEAARVKFLGRAGSISAWAERMKSLSKEEKPVVGKLLNEARTSVTAAIAASGERLRADKEARALANIDLSLPGTVSEIGALHPLTQMLDRAIGIFRRMGFALAEGPDVETEWHCFDALNTAPDHPARNEQDTFFLPDGRLLRTHTSTVQIRTMENAPPPIRVIAPGAAYRRDEVDATHSAQFHQIEGLYIDEKVSVADLKGTLEFFLRELFGAETQIRFRPHYFPFTEPSLEVDVKSKALRGGEQWLEMCGCGMVHPAVYEQVNSARGDNAYDPEKWSGFAFGLGMDRLAMILFGIPDLRYFAANDLRFLRQFA